MPDSLQRIEQTAFEYCSSLRSITIPAGVIDIEGEAFWGCTTLSAVFCLPQIPPTLGTDVFTGAHECFIYIPYSSDHSILEAYKTATNWAAYADRILELPEDYQ